MEKHSSSFEFYKMMWDNSWTDEATLKLTIVSNTDTANGITGEEFTEITGISLEPKSTPIVNTEGQNDITNK